MLGTGAVMAFPDPWADRWRTGATFVHDWLLLAIAVVTAGHLWQAFQDRGALQGMLTGRVDLEWAQRHHAGWAGSRTQSRDYTRKSAGGSENAQVSAGERDPGSPPGADGPDFAHRRPGMP